LKAFNIVVRESKTEFKNLLSDYRSGDWRANESPAILRSRVTEAILIVQNAELMAAQAAFLISARREEPRADLMSRYERQLIKIRRDAIRAFGQRRFHAQGDSSAREAGSKK
jgi:hypothetical protein